VSVCVHYLLFPLKAYVPHVQSATRTTALSLTCFQNVNQYLSGQQIYGMLMSEIILSIINKVISRINVLIRISVLCFEPSVT